MQYIGLYFGEKTFRRNKTFGWVMKKRITQAMFASTSKGYDPAQRAYVAACEAGGRAGRFHASFEATVDSPLMNPAIVIENWGEQIPRLRVNDKAVPWGPDFRYGQERSLEGTNLVIWMKLQASNPTTVDLIPANGN